jgi:DeoR/GlpR family transcriptional regulator of sugar metabolism
VGALIVKGFNFMHNRHTIEKCLESSETYEYVEIPQKLEVSNMTIRRSQVFLHF